MIKTKLIIQKIRDFFEIILPCAAFLTMFITYILQVFMRYVMRSPLTWSNEVIVCSFTWMVLLGACYSMREKNHVKFTMVTDALPKKLSSAFKIAGNVIIVGTFILMIPASLGFLSNVAKQFTPVFKWALNTVFIPVIYFFLSLTEYSIEEIIGDVKVILEKEEN